MKRDRSRHSFWALVVTLIFIVTTGSVSRTFAENAFNPAFLVRGAIDPNKADEPAHHRFQSGDTYYVDIYINDKMIDTWYVPFQLSENSDGQHSLQPCFSLENLKQLGINVNIYPQLQSDGTHTGQCMNLSVIPQADAVLQFSAQRLNIRLPAEAITIVPSGYVPVDRWDDGINAVLLNYSLTGVHHIVSPGSAADSQFISLQPGINLGAWRFRNYSTWNSSNQDKRWESIYSYAMRDIHSLKSQLTIGDSNTPSDLFDSVAFRGVQVMSDEDMVTDSLNSYVPVVRGIARSNAEVTVRQNGYVIYQSHVAPGAFEINDIYPTGSSGDLDVTIKEADGSEQHLLVPYASLAMLLREGVMKYSLSSGQYRSYNNSIEPTVFTQLTGSYGLPWGMTAYGGSQVAGSKYHALQAGFGKSMGILGALSIDATQAKSALRQGEHFIQNYNGHSFRARYNKNILQTGTNVTVAGYRYSTDGFYGLTDVLESYSNNSKSYQNRQRNRQEALVSQKVGEGALSLSFINEDYWNNSSTASAGIGYNFSWDRIRFGLNYTYSRNTTASSGTTYTDSDQISALNISIPLDRWHSTTSANYNISNSKKGGVIQNTGLSGSGLEGNKLSWNAQAGYDRNNNNTTGNVGMAYKSGYGETNAAYSYDNHSQKLNYGVAGGVVIHQDGITLSQSLGETIALIKAPGFNNVNVNNQTGVYTDFRGYGVLPSVQPYRRNQVSLTSLSGLDDDQSIQPVRMTVPTRGAVVVTEFDTHPGYRVLMTLLRTEGGPVPFGAVATLENGEHSQSSLVGEEGQVFLNGLEQDGDVLVQWGKADEQSCRVSYRLPEGIPLGVIHIVQQTCS
ncbi:fimbrial biogenesis outer membrane usher protein [Budviciaceae bacterium BWR-B9]|uniref:Fimbrial biogenesis outer membrane usher protein n=1 Tax=Limnobaculum allomyrinae TaxID=2791986 RepID=A0ABS1IRJ2_9GAMM|nr:MULTISPECIES: fimbria/pilus outer membrane usher protein [Limnobaculum]MBK5144367.1 fimbrial biogenesis outer membrane usher protein [Limnobaculum allomyrinae]MBV7691888.1 fimbrial biogenesis outer membrane usher protein [Limnobaculum sp. M2-1]